MILPQISQQQSMLNDLFTLFSIGDSWFELFLFKTAELNAEPERKCVSVSRLLLIIEYIVFYFFKSMQRFMLCSTLLSRVNVIKQKHTT